MTHAPPMLQDPWGARARDWAEVEDEGSRGLFEDVLDLVAVGPGTELLDVGCGSGLACRIARSRGASVAGIDSSPGLLALAQEALPDGDFRVGDMVSLPWGDASFTCLTYINTFFFASDQMQTLREAKRVLRTGGRVAVVSWSSPERVQSMAYLGAVGPLLPAMPVDIDPFIAPPELETLALGAGLKPERVVDLEWVWNYPNQETALRGLLSVGLSTVAIEVAGEAAVRRALVEGLEPFRRDDGSYRLVNLVHCLIAVA